MGSESDDPQPDPIATPETTKIPEGIITVPASGPPMFTDPDLGYAFAYPTGWVLQRTGNETEGVVMSMISSDGSVVVDIYKIFPPPRVPDVDQETHLRGYAEAILDMAKLDSPEFEVVARDVVELNDGTLAFAARYAIRGESLLAGDILVVIRSEDEAALPFGDEAFVVRATGPAIPYLANNGNIQIVMEGFTLISRASGEPPSP